MGKNKQRIFLFVEDALSTLYHDLLIRQQHAWWIIEGATGFSREQILLMEKIDDNLCSAVERVVSMHVQMRMPLAYCIGSVPFLDLRIMVESPILIPRMETEEWVADLIDRYKKSGVEPSTILDIGTGSGCIALALARAFPNALITAIDCNQQALSLAHKNSVLNHISNIRFIESNLFENLENQKFDLILSNPPYISFQEYKTLEPSVRDWEDKGALIADEDGLAIIKQIIAQAPAYLNTAFLETSLPSLVIEIGYQQGFAVSSLFQKQDILVFLFLKIWRDMIVL